MEKSGNFYIEEAESDFKRVHKSIILNKDIDCLTLGIYVKILVLGKKWQLNIKGLSSYFDISDMKIRKSISLLEKEGYISRKAVQDEKTGKLAGWNYTLHAIPLEESKRTCAGKKNSEETVYPENRQHGYPTTRLSDNTETGEDNNNKLKEDIDLKEIDKPNQYKEKEDKSSSKKDDYLPIAAESQQEYGKVVEKKEWREDFNAYINLVNQAKRDLLSDSEYKEYIEKYYPNADYENSVGKLVDGFWGTEEGWDYCKKKRKGKTINMLSTLKKNLDARSRIVYKPLQNTKQNPLFNSKKNAVKVKLNPNVHLVDNEGKLSDGTFLKSDGLRYYFSYIDKKTYSIPLDAEPMPQSEKIAYDYKTGWYECE